MRRIIMISAVAALLFASLLPQTGLAQNEREEFTAWAINLVAGPGPSNATVDITVDRWSTDAQRDQLLAAVKEGGPDALLTALQKMPVVGRIRTPDSLGYDLRYARQAPLDEGGRQIVIGTDRPIGYWEARNRPRVFDYRFTVIEMRLDKTGEGEGRMLAQTKIFIDNKQNLVLENYAQQPVMLKQVRKRS